MWVACVKVLVSMKVYLDKTWVLQTLSARCTHPSNGGQRVGRRAGPPGPAAGDKIVLVWRNRLKDGFASASGSGSTRSATDTEKACQLGW